ncbi:unnamed protein product [Callosobruchus maculatus]|uniref:Uncharacterized protein n=1 Tax=Callosobruchus maculatus TaxID=64391 RepID=A0A653C653_CALMS|nr:unnamed protein product [Callosobruchus maculatus]
MEISSQSILKVSQPLSSRTGSRIVLSLQNAILAWKRESSENCEENEGGCAEDWRAGNLAVGRFKPNLLC